MPEVCLYPAPSHVPASSAPSETILSNGNHLGGVLIINLAQQQIENTTTTTSSSNITCTSTTTTTTSSFSSRFYTSNRKHTKSTPVMGLTDSKQPSETKLHTLFDQYKDDENDDLMLAEGIEQFCKDLQISPDDFRILIFAWKLKAEQMCRFTRNEFINGLKLIKADSIRTIQLRLPDIISDVEKNDEQFKDLYRFTFKFGLDNTIGQRILTMDMAIILWRLVFTIREPPILNRWLKYLEIQDNTRGIPRDTWNMFLNFSESVGNDLSSYDDNEAWPSLFDDFVEYENDQANQNITNKDNKELDGLLMIKNE